MERLIEDLELCSLCVGAFLGFLYTENSRNSV